MVRSQDIADIVGVSRQAVSAVLNGRGSSSVSAAKRELILKVAREMNYQPNYQAKNLARGCSRVIGFLYSQQSMLKMLRSPVYPRLINSLSVNLAARGYELSLIGIEDTCDADGILQTVNSGRVDGVICSSYFNSNDPRAEQKHPQQVIFATTTTSEEVFSDIRINGETGIAGLADHLRQQGHEKIAYIGQKGFRLEQHLRIFAERNIPLSEKFIVTEGMYAGNPGDALTCFEITSLHLDMLRNCTAVIFNNDYYARGGCAALRQAGIVPGRDIAVAGHDNLEECDMPFLTTTTAPYDIMGERCAERICAQLNGRQVPSGETINNQLIIRASTADYQQPNRE